MLAFGVLAFGVDGVTYVLPGALMVEHSVAVQNSDTTPYNKFVCSKNEIAGKNRANIIR